MTGNPHVRTGAPRHGAAVHPLAANLVLLFHFAFVALAVFGGFGVLIERAWAWIHVPIVVWSSVVNLAGWTCPLTPLENRLRAARAGAGYEGGFVEHYIGPLVYPRGMPRRLELIAGGHGCRVECRALCGHPLVAHAWRSGRLGAVPSPRRAPRR